jgi:hypothetical protein
VNRELAKKVADALLYEGYRLYPYRPSALKNRQRWTFGILYPHEYGEVLSGTERSGMHSECLLETGASTLVRIELRFLQLISRQVARTFAGRLEPVPSLVIDNRVVESWDEGLEQSVEFDLPLVIGTQQLIPFRFCGNWETDSLADHAGNLVGVVNRIRQEVTGTISICAEKIRDHVSKLTIDVINTTSLPEDEGERNSALLRSLLSAHLILIVNDGKFVSLLDPPEGLRESARGCKNVGNFPVLVGNESERDMLLCSPIILYDYPKIATESAGDFYDSTEIDEMLTLRVMTLTDKEKDEMRVADAKTCNLLQRTEQTAHEQLIRTHGTMHASSAMQEATTDWKQAEGNRRREEISVRGIVVKPGDRVRLCPNKSADIMDLVLKGKIAIVEAIEYDFDEKVHLAVVIEDDPGRDLGLLRQPGHRFFFSPEDIEPLIIEVPHEK